MLIHTADEQTLRKPGPKSGDASPIHLLAELWRPSLWRMAAAMVQSGGFKLTGVEGAETFGAGDVLDVPGRPRAVHTPGHTPGHCVFHFEGHGAVFAGDAMCSLNPVTGARGPQVMPSAMNVSTARARDSLSAIESVPVDVLLFGHGEPWRGRPAAAVQQARGAS